MNYTLKSKLGEGGMAIVHLAEDHKFHTEVALKMLKKEFVSNENIKKRFLAEARSMFRMSHPHVIRVSDLIDEGDTVAFVMEYVEGETLKAYLERKGALPDNEVREIFSQMLDAVGYVHEQKLVHRDIKPSNFMIDKRGKVKLMDFGIAKSLDPNAAEYTQTGTGMQMGTPMYMSPEQIKSTKEVTSSSDIYSLGVVLWQMVTGLKPYDTLKLSTFELQTQIVQEPLVKTNSTWDILIQKATDKNVKNRYQSCAELRLALNKPTKKQKTRDGGNGLNQNEDKTFMEQVKPEKISKSPKPKKAVLQLSTQSEQVESEVPKKRASLWRIFAKVVLFVIVAFLILKIGDKIFMAFFPSGWEDVEFFDNPISDIPSDAISGDFNGDGELDYMWLQEPELTASNEDCVGECVSYIKFSDLSIPEIEVTNSIGGTPSNLGDLNSDGTDEIGLLPAWFSSCWREYFVWTFKNESWEYAVNPFNTHCNQWDEGIRPIEIDPSRSGNVIIRYSEQDEDFEIVTRSMSIDITNPKSEKDEKPKKFEK